MSWLSEGQTVSGSQLGPVKRIGPVGDTVGFDRVFCRLAALRQRHLVFGVTEDGLRGWADTHRMLQIDRCEGNMGGSVGGVPAVIYVAEAVEGLHSVRR